MTDMWTPKTQKGLFGNGVLWVLGLLVLCAAVGGAVWAFNTGTASVQGKAGAFRQKESAENRLFAQQDFEQLSADIDGYVAKVVVAKRALKDDQAAGAAAEQLQIDRTNVSGTQGVCIDAVQQYNADSHKYLLRDFKSAGLDATRSVGECS